MPPTVEQIGPARAARWKRRPRAPLRWWQNLLRALASAALAAWIGYVALPWWAPTGWLARRIEQDLTEQLGVPARIASMSITWGRGVEIHGLTIDSPREFGPEPLAHIESIRTDFSPIRFLANRRLEWMDVDQPQVNVRALSGGRSNLEPLKGLRMDVTAAHICVRAGRAAVQLPDTARPLLLKIHDLQAEFTPEGRLGPVSLSAAVEQSPQSGDATVSLRSGRQDASVAAAASLRFSNLDLGELPLAAGGPLKELLGRCSGRLNLQVSRRGVVEAFGLELAVRRLEVWPAQAEKWPAIDEASLRLSAAYDQINEALEVRSAELSLPGAELRGEAKIFLQALAGHVEAVERLELAGRVQPARLAKMLLGSESLGGGMKVAGPVELSLHALREGGRTVLNLSLDANGAAILHGSAVLKPPGRTGRMRLDGALHHQPRRLVVGEVATEIGGNKFLGRGAMEDLGLLVSRWAGGEEPNAPGMLSQLASLGWQGSCEIRDSAALTDLLPESAGSWREARLDGVIRGQLQVQRVQGARVRGGIVVAPESRLAVPGLIAKQPGGVLSFDGEAFVEPDGRTVRGVDLDFVAGKARVHVHRGELHLGQAALDTACTLTGENVQALADALPSAGQFAKVAGGNVSARVSGRLTDASLDANMSADLKETAIGAGAWWRKAAGEPAAARVAVRLDRADAGLPTGRAALAASYESPGGKIALRSRSDLALPTDVAPANVELDANVSDAGWLAASAPALAALLADARLSGALRVAAAGHVGADAADANAFVDAGAMEYRDAVRGKAAGVPLTLRVRASARRDGDRLFARAEGCEVKLAGSDAHLSGQVEFAPGRGKTAAELVAGPARLDLHARVKIDDALRSALPELDGALKRHGITGRAVLDANAVAAGSNWRAAVRLDARELDVANLLEANHLPDPNWPAELATIAKRAGVAASLEAKLAAAGPSAKLEKFDAHVGDLRASGWAEGTLRDGRLSAVSGKFALALGDAAKLSVLVPGVEKYKLLGEARLEAEVADAGGPVTARGSVELAKVTFEHNGRRVFVHGRVDANGGAGPTAGSPLSLDALRTESLEFRVGDNHGWLLADVSGLGGACRGKVHVLAERLDLKDLADWSGESDANEPNVPYYKLSPARTAAVAAAGKRAAETLKRLLAGAELEGRLSVGHLRSWDPSVRCYYDLEQLEVSASAARQRVNVELRGGLNGGAKRDRYSFRLGEDDPNVTIESDLDEVLAEENFQPQLAKFFPGNTVQGHFSRRERTAAPLSQCLAAAIDSRWPLHAVGWSRSEAVEGVTEGRSAPEWMANIFPGLNLTKYYYRRMSTFAEHLPDGTTANDMVFDGKSYDLFMEGETDPNNIGRYKIGLILLGSPQTPEWNHKYKQGRLPILNFQARIEGGRMNDQRVSYPYPDETLGTVLLKNNLVYRVWLEGGKKSGVK